MANRIFATIPSLALIGLIGLPASVAWSEETLLASLSFSPSETHGTLFESARVQGPINAPTLASYPFTQTPTYWLPASNEEVGEEILRILDGDVPWPEPLAPELKSQIAALYTDQGGMPLWYGPQGWDQSLDAALTQVSQAHLDGLRPDDYGIDPARLYTLAEDTASLAAADLMVTAAFLPYVDHMANGRHAPRPRFDAAELLAAHAHDGAGAFLASLVPAKIEYRRLRQALSEARAQVRAQVPIPLLSEGPYLRLGVQGDRVADLRHILSLTGDYVMDPAHRYSLAFDPRTFDATLDAAVRAYQSRMGLSADGVVGRGTRGALNTRPASDIALIKVNMERLRWEMPLGEDTTYVRVNIPHYRLEVRENDRQVMDMRVIVGRRDRPTPLLSDRIVNLKFSPDWTVPSTIYREDILPRLAADPSYANRMGYSIRTARGSVSAHSVDWTSPPSVTVYRGPSANGPLGGVRFSLTNSIGIFLHDTNSRSLFDRDRRTLSSGCVRVGDPAGLAHFLTENDGWTRDEIEGAMNRGRISWASVNNDVGVRVYLSYMTIFVDEEGELVRTADPYGKDAALLDHFDDL